VGETCGGVASPPGLQLPGPEGGQRTTPVLRLVWRHCDPHTLGIPGSAVTSALLAANTLHITDILRAGAIHMLERNAIDSNLFGSNCSNHEVRLRFLFFEGYNFYVLSEEAI